MCACTSSGSSTPSPLGDASTCIGNACTPGAGGSLGTGGASGAGGDGGVFTDLCPRRGPVVGPLPSGLAIVFSLPDDQHAIGQLLATDSVLLWKDQSKIGRVSLSDGSETVVVDYPPASIDHSLVSFAMDDQYVYFGDSVVHGATSLGLARFPLSGSGAPTTIVSNPNVGLVAVSEGYVYYEDEVTHGVLYQSRIARVATTGGTPTEVLNGVLGGVRGLAVGGGYVYFMGTIGVGSYSNFYLARVPITARAPALDAGQNVVADAGVAPAGSELVATTSGLDVSGPVTDAVNLYFGDEDRLLLAPLTGGTPVSLAQAPPITGLFTETAAVFGITPHGDSVYWSSGGCQALRKSPIAGGTETTVVQRVTAGAMAANSTHLYFAPTNGQVLSAPL